MKKSISFLIFFIILFSSFSFSLSASFVPDTSGSSVDSYYLYNVENGYYMAEHGVDKIVSPSATAKMMTACIALESGVDTGKVISVTEAMLEGSVGRRMGLKAGDRLSVLDLLYTTVCGGYNDSSQVLAYTVTEDLQSFVALMNQKADELKMTATHYTNVTGVDDAEAFTCAIDVMKLAKHLLENEDFLAIASTSSYKLSSSATCDKEMISNRSSLFSSYRGVANFCTGSGDFGGCNVIFYKGKNLSFIAIVMGALPPDRDEDIACAEDISMQLLDFAIYDHSYKVIMTEKTVVASLPVIYSTEADINLYLSGDLYAYLPSDVDEKDLSFNYYVYGDELKAPLKSGDEVGRILVSYDGMTVASAPLTVKEDVPKSGFLYFLDTIKNYIKGPAFISSCIIFACLMVGYYIYKQRIYRVVIHRSSNKRR